MLRTISKFLGMTALLAVILSPVARAIDEEVVDQDYLDRLKIDRYLDVEVWTNHSDNEFYEGDNVVINFRANRDAFVAIYSVDSRGRVNLLFPTSAGDENYVRGGVTYSLPDGGDDFDLVVSGPEGVENIQAVASREKFPVPEWYPTSGLVCDWDDRLEFMDYINGQYFVRYDGQRFAFDRTAIYINEWEEEYYRPIYYPHYHNWTVCGNAYIDYPWGATVYINGIYWGVTPLYIPRIYVGWHTFTIYDYYGACWEYPVHVTRYNTVILDRSIVVTSPTVVSKYKDVRTVGYRDPITSGYPKFKTKSVVTASKPALTSTTVTKTTATPALSKKYIKGSAKVVKTERGFETVGVSGKSTSKTVGKSGSSTSRKATDSKSGSVSKGKSESSSSSRYKSASRSSDSERSSGSSKATTSDKSGKSSDYYQKKSGSSTYKKSSDAAKSSRSKSVEKSSSSSRAKSSSSKAVKKSDSGSKAKPSAPSKVKSSGGSSKTTKSSGSNSSGTKTTSKVGKNSKTGR